MTLWVVVIVAGVIVLIALGVAIGLENETENQLRRRQEAAHEARRLHEERRLLDEAREQVRIERRKLQRAQELGAPRCPNCPYRDKSG